MSRVVVLVLLVSLAFSPVASAAMLAPHATSPMGWLGALHSALSWLLDGLTVPGGGAVVPNPEHLRNLSGAMIIPSGSPAAPPAQSGATER